jgi:hypothetical protein
MMLIIIYGGLLIFNDGIALAALARALSHDTTHRRPLLIFANRPVMSI